MALVCGSEGRGHTAADRRSERAALLHRTAVGHAHQAHGKHDRL